MKQIEKPERINGDPEVDGNTPLADAIAEYKNDKRTSFHVPGHKGFGLAGGFRDFFAEELLRSDLTELPGLDDFHHPAGVIREAQELAADLFGAEETFFLTNGTTSGLVAAVAAVSSEEHTVILERHSHECLTRGLVLSGATPVYVYNAYDENTGLSSGISSQDVRDVLANCHLPAAVVLSHPSYYGTYSDLRAIIETAHQAGVAVIVDEAHGAQLAFTEQQGIPSALSAGADIVVQSTHKMLGSLTQTSMLHVQGARVNREALRYYISFMHSTSPSYLLMSSLDLTRAFLAKQGRKRWKTISMAFRETGERLNQLNGIYCPRFFHGCDDKQHELESARLLVSAWELGMTGMELGRILASQYKVDVEFSDLRYTVILAGTSSREEDLKVLSDAIADLAEKPPESIDPIVEQQLLLTAKVHTLRPKAGMTPRQAVKARILRLRGEHAEGMVSARDISLYPPGIPVIRTGEIFTREIIDYIETAGQFGMELHGVAEPGEKGEMYFFCAEDPRMLEMMNGFF